MVMRCRPGIVTHSELGTIPDLRCTAARCTASGKRALSGRFAAFDHDGLDLAGAAPAEGRRFVVFLRRETGDALLQRRKLDDDEALKLVRAFHDLEFTAARQNLAAIFGDDGRYAIGIFLVLD